MADIAIQKPGAPTPEGYPKIKLPVWTGDVPEPDEERAPAPTPEADVKVTADVVSDDVKVTADVVSDDTPVEPLEIEIRPASHRIDVSAIPLSDNPNDVNTMMLKAYEDQTIVGDETSVINRASDGSYYRISENAHHAQMAADQEQELSLLSSPEQEATELEAEGAAPAAEEEDGGFVEGVQNFFAGMPEGLVEGTANLNDLFPIGEWVTEDGRKLTTLRDAMNYLGELTGLDAKPPPKPEGSLAAEFGKGFAMFIPTMIPLVKALRMAKSGPVIADIVGGAVADFATSGMTEAEGFISMFKMLPEEADVLGIPFGELSASTAAALEDFINADPGSLIDTNFRARLFAGIPGIVFGSALTPALKGIGKLAVLAKDSGAGQHIIKAAKEFFADTSGSVKLPGQAAVAEGNLWGLMSRFRQAATVQPEHTKPLITAATNTKNATRQAKGLDDVVSRHPDPFSSEEAFSNMWADALGDTDVPIPPYRLIQMANEGRLYDEMLDLSPDQIRMAEDGLEFANDFASLYRAGGNAQADATTTAKLTLWGMLSRGVSPSVQEAGFLDAINGIEPFIQAALGGKFDDKMLARYLDWASGVIKEGSFGRGTQHNLNSFGKAFLRKMGAGEAGNSPLQQFHDLLSDQSISSKDVRRRFYELADDPGINNKVLSFMMLLAGRKDVVIVDRIQAKAFFDDGRFDDLNLWDGVKVRTAKGKLATKAGTSLAEIFKGHRGLLLYEQIEALLARQLPKGVTPGEWHWKTWVKRGNQEADHASLLGLIKQVRGDLDPYLGAKSREGRFGTWNYGFSQVKTKRGFTFEYPASDGTIYTFTKDTKEALISDIKKRGSGVVPKGFSVQKAGKEGRPWTEAEGVDLGKLDKLIRKHGRKGGSTQSGDGTVPASGEGRAAAGPRGGRGRGRRKLDAPLNPPKGGS